MGEPRLPHLSCPGPSPTTCKLPSHSDEVHLGVEEEGDDFPNLATEECVGSPAPRFSSVMRSPVAGTSMGAEFRTPTAGINLGTSHGLDEDAEGYDVDGEGDGNQQNVIDLDDPVDDEEIARATKRLRSDYWKEFLPIVVGGVVVKGRCKHCDVLIGAPRGGGTSALGTHLTRFKKRNTALQIMQNLSSTL